MAGTRGFYAMKDKVTIRLYLKLKALLLASEAAGYNPLVTIWTKGSLYSERSFIYFNEHTVKSRK